MANTIIELKHSQVSGNVPSSLANGEISINTYDGKLFYKDPSGVIQPFDKYPGPSGLDGEVQFNDSGELGASNKLSFNKTTGVITVTGGAIVGGVNVIPEIALAFARANTKTFTFEQNTAPSTANSSDFWVNSDTGVMYQNFGNTTNPIWAEVGPTGTLTNTSPGIVNGTIVYANNVDLFSFSSAAFNKANSSNVIAQSSYDFANSINTYAQSAYSKANTGTTHASSAYDKANSAYGQANTATTNASNADTKASNAWTTANTGVTHASSAYDKANSAYGQANTGTTHASAAFNKANTSITTSGGSINGQLDVSYSPATTVNTAVSISAANTKGGPGYADVLSITNSSGGASNRTKWLRLNSSGGLEIINSAYTSGILTLTDGGNLSVPGTVTPGSYTAGQVIKDTILSNSEVTVVSTTIAATGSNVNFVTYNYTPVSSSSYLIVHFHLSRYDPVGTTDDSWYSILAVDGSEISYSWQMVNDNGTGTSGRSGVLFPLMGRYTNSSTASKQIQVAARRDAADDSINIINSATSMWLRITEVAR